MASSAPVQGSLLNGISGLVRWPLRPSVSATSRACVSTCIPNYARCTFDPMLGPVLFAGVVVEPGVIEIADFEIDPDYWQLIEDAPND